MTTGIQVVFDCADPDRLARFWAEALHYQLQPPPPGFGSWEDFLRAHDIPEEEWNKASAVVDPAGEKPRFYFQKVPEGKTVKNRVHLDLNVSGGRDTPLEERKHDIWTEVKRLEGAGATVAYTGDMGVEHGEYFVTMCDPEGNEFCLH